MVFINYRHYYFYIPASGSVECSISPVNFGLDGAVSSFIACRLVTSGCIQIVVGDVVIFKQDEGPRNQWPLARVVEVYPSEDGCIRKV